MTFRALVALSFLLQSCCPCQSQLRQDGEGQPLAASPSLQAGGEGSAEIPRLPLVSADGTKVALPWIVNSPGGSAAGVRVCAVGAASLESCRDFRLMDSSEGGCRDECDFPAWRSVLKAEALGPATPMTLQQLIESEEEDSTSCRVRKPEVVAEHSGLRFEVSGQMPTLVAVRRGADLVAEGRLECAEPGAVTEAFVAGDPPRVFVRHICLFADEWIPLAADFTKD